MKTRAKMSIEKVKDFFKIYNMDTRIMEFDISSATVKQAAAALDCPPERIAKTLSFDVKGQTVLIVTSGDKKIDNAKYKNIFGTKAKMLTAEEVINRIGHAVGGVCPFGINSGINTYLDISLKRFETVFPACGSSNSAIELSINELEKYSFSAAWIDVCK